MDVEGRRISEEVEYHSGKSVVEREGLGVFLFGFFFAVQYDRYHLGFLSFSNFGTWHKVRKFSQMWQPQAL